MTTLKQQISKVQSGEISSESLVQSALDRIGAAQHLKAYLSILPEYALEKARDLDKRRNAGEKLGPLAGTPIAVKDNIVISSGKTTCASRILENFESPYDAAVVERLIAAGAIPVGKTNLDELFRVFFTVHDPTTLNRQGNDRGTQYRSVIFYNSEMQKQEAKAIISALTKAKAFDDPIVTTLEPFTAFYSAEKYHQNYYQNNKSQPYCQYVIQPKLEKFEKVFKNRLKK